MTRKLSIILFLALLAPLFTVMPASAAKSYYAERFDVQVDIQENGSAIITETVEFHFSGDPFTFAFREISTTETDGITFLDASMDGVQMPQGTQPGQVEIETGNPLKVTWHFPPTSDTARVFTVRYLAEGVIRKGDADALIWRAIPEEHDYSIAHSTITLTYPPDATLLEAPTLNRPFDVSPAENQFTLTLSGMDEDEALILTARFSPNSLTTVAPQWQLQQERRDAAMTKAVPVGIITGIATFFLGGLGLLIFARANRRDVTINPVISTANPPSNLSPALAGKLTKQHHTFMGTIFDLAQRGVLEVREEKGLWGMSKHHILIRKQSTAQLQPYEQALLEALFKPTETEIKMNEIATRFGAKSGPFDELLEQDLVQRGWLDPERKQKQKVLSGLGVLLMLLSIVILILSILLGSASSDNSVWLSLIAALLGLTAGGFVLSIPTMIYGGTFSVLTPAGEEQSARWKGFADYLKRVSKGKETAIRSDTFEKYLAYAATFGLGASWAKYFQNLGGVPLPVWFHATADSGMGDFGAMVAVMYASDSAGAGDGGAGGAGASGGGASGAG